MAFAALGGCLPLIVANLNFDGTPVPHGVYLPFADVIDYCKVGFVVPIFRTPSFAGRQVPAMRETLDALDRISADEWRVRQRAARRYHDMFVYREHSAVSTPSAAEFVVAAMCRLQKDCSRNTGQPNDTTYIPPLPKTSRICPPPGLGRKYAQMHHPELNRFLGQQGKSTH